MTLLNLALTLIYVSGAFGDVRACDGCLDGDALLLDGLEKIALMAPKQQLEQIRKEGVCIKVADSGRKAPPKFFSWSQVEKPTLALKEATSLADVMGKSFCRGERPLSRACPTIVLASDAPASTLLHEYLHVKQAERSTSWCALSKKLWNRPPTKAEDRIVRDLEWDAHKMLWSNRARLKLGLEDKIAVAGETIEEAKKRRDFDPTTLSYLQREKVAQSFRELIQEYQGTLK